MISSKSVLTKASKKDSLSPKDTGEEGMLMALRQPKFDDNDDADDDADDVDDVRPSVPNPRPSPSINTPTAAALDFRSSVTIREASSVEDEEVEEGQPEVTAVPTSTSRFTQTESGGGGADLSAVCCLA